MDVQKVRPNVRTCGMLAVSVGCAIFFSSPLAAQTAGDPAKAQMQEMNRREMQLNNLDAGREQPNNPKRSQAMMDQVNEDFQRILILHNEIVRAITANRALNYRFISDATGEIGKRSARLQSSLKLQKPESAAETQKTITDPKTMATNDRLVVLCKQIESFVKNPIIEKPGTVDAQQLERARRDLQSIVELSGEIKKEVDKQKP